MGVTSGPNSMRWVCVASQVSEGHSGSESTSGGLALTKWSERCSEGNRQSERRRLDRLDAQAGPGVGAPSTKALGRAVERIGVTERAFVRVVAVTARCDAVQRGAEFGIRRRRPVRGASDLSQLCIGDSPKLEHVPVLPRFRQRSKANSRVQYDRAFRSWGFDEAVVRTHVCCCLRCERVRQRRVV